MKRRLPLGSRLDRYVLAHFIASYASALGLLLGLFLVLDMASNLDDWLEPWADGSTVERGVIGRYYLMQLPFFYLQLAPFVTLLAGMFTVNKLLRKNEVVAMLGAGLGVLRTMLPVYIAGALLAVGMFGLREWVGHGLTEKRDALVHRLEKQGAQRELENVAIRDLSGSMVLLDRYLPEPAGGGPPTAEGLTLLLRQDGTFLRVQATRAEWDGGRFRLVDGWRESVSRGDGEAQGEPVEVLEGFELTPEVISASHRLTREPLDMSFSEVGRMIERAPDDPGLLTLWHYQLTFPLANLVLLLVGLPVMFSYERGRGTERMALGGLVCVFYFAADFVLRSMGLAGGLDPVWAAWLPVLAFGSLGMVLTEGVRT